MIDYDFMIMDNASNLGKSRFLGVFSVVFPEMSVHHEWNTGLHGSLPQCYRKVVFTASGVEGSVGLLNLYNCALL